MGIKKLYKLIFLYTISIGKPRQSETPSIPENRQDSEIDQEYCRSPMLGIQQEKICNPMEETGHNSNRIERLG